MPLIRLATICAAFGARISVDNEMDTLIGGMLPRHNHGNQLLKRHAEKVEMEVIKRSTTNQATAKAVITEIVVKVVAEYGESHLTGFKMLWILVLSLAFWLGQESVNKKFPRTALKDSIE